MLLAAEWATSSTIVVDVELDVATSLAELTGRVRASLPAALAAERVARADEAARQRVEDDRVIDDLVGSAPRDRDRDPRAAPSLRGEAEPCAPVDLLALPPALAAAATGDPLVRRGLQARLDRLREEARSDAPSDDMIADALRTQLPSAPRRGRRPRIRTRSIYPRGW